MSELYGSSAEDGDPGPTDASQETNEADRYRETPESHDIERPEEDEEPLSRGEYTHMMHDQAAAEDDDSDDGDDGDGGSYDDQYPAALEASDRAELAEPRTRQEVAEETADDSTDPETDYQDEQASADPNINFTEQDKLPEPRTRQEVTDEARSGADPLAHGEPGTDATALPEQVPDTAAEHLSPDPDPDQQEPHGQDRDDNPYARVTAVQADATGRTLGDTTPTGIGLKPTGEQLLRMEDDSKSFLEKLRGNIYERADDITDAGDEYGGALEKLFERPPTATHMEVPGNPQGAPHQQEHAIDGGHMATAAFVVGVLGFELFRTIKNRVEIWRGRLR